MKHCNVAEHDTSRTSQTSVNDKRSPKHSDNSTPTHHNGEGSQPDSAVIQPRHEEQDVEHTYQFADIDDYQTLISVLESLPDGSTVRFDTPSHVMWSQVVGADGVQRREKSKLQSQIESLIKEKHLTIDPHWIPRQLQLR